MPVASTPVSTSTATPTRRDGGLTEPGEGQPDPSMPATIGRFAVLRPIGEGGMGVVYSGFDEELDRRVAIKLVRYEADSTADDGEIQARIQREAQAIARVTHPNVVSVYEVGRHQGRVFVAMEFVRGKTLRSWQDEPRSWSEVLAVYRQAGAGLGAAHAAGLIHRDFKPDNAMIGDADGRVRVLDFGLARAAGDAAHEVPGPTADPVESYRREATSRESQRNRRSVPAAAGAPETASPTLGEGPEAPPHVLEPTDDESRPFERLTRTGAVLGTPAYMAPEQFLGRSVDARTDIFSFCVALYEGLYRERPFEGATRIALLHNVVEGNRRPPPQGTAVPRWLHEVVVRGLAPEPDQRPASMADLLEALGRDPRRRRRRLALGFATAGAVAGAAGLGLIFGSGTNSTPCEGLELPLQGVWNNEARARLAIALGQVDVSFAKPTTERVVGSLDAYAARWGTLRQEVCAATRIRGEQSEARLDRAMVCLDDRRRAFEALLGALQVPDAETITKAPTAVESLPLLQACTDARYLDAQVEPPPPRLAATVENLRTHLAQAEAQLVLGHTALARKSYETLVEQARRTDYDPLRAEAALALGILRSAMKDVDETVVDLFVEAVTASEASGASELQAHAYLHLARSIDQMLQSPEDAARWEALAEASLSRLGEGATEVRALLLTSQADRASAARDYDRALALLEQAQHLTVQQHGEDALQTSTSTVHLGAILAKLGRFEDARAEIDHAISVLERELGPDHPLVIEALSIRGQALMDEGEAVAAIEQLEDAIARTRRAFGPRSVALIGQLHELAAALASLNEHERAVALAQEAYDIAVQELGPDHLETGYAAQNLGGELFRAHEHERAREVSERAAQILKVHLSPEHVQMAYLYDLLGGLAFRRQDFEEAERYATSVLEIRRRVHQGPHPEVGSAMSNLGEVYEAEGKLAKAEMAYRDSLTIRRASVGADHPGVARTRVRLGRTVLAQGRAAEALEHFEDARRIHEVHQVSAEAEAQTQQWIAKAKQALPKQK